MGVTSSITTHPFLIIPHHHLRSYLPTYHHLPTYLPTYHHLPTYHQPIITYLPIITSYFLALGEKQGHSAAMPEVNLLKEIRLLGYSGEISVGADICCCASDV